MTKGFDARLKIDIAFAVDQGESLTSASASLLFLYFFALNLFCLRSLPPSK